MGGIQSYSTHRQKQTLHMSFEADDSWDPIDETRLESAITKFNEGGYENIVFSGGGMLGLAYAGILRFWELAGFKPRRLLGVSAGGLAALCYCLGYTPAEMKGLLLNADFGVLKDWSIWNARDKYSICTGDALKTMIHSIIKRKLRTSDLTFQHLYRLNGIKFITSATRVEDHTSVFFSVDTTPKMSVAEAVLLSCSVPAIFPPGFRNGSTFIDGGIKCNFPLHKFDSEEPNRKTFGFLVTTDRSKSKMRRNLKNENVFAYLWAVITLMRLECQRQYIRPSDESRLLRIDAHEVRSHQYDMDEACRNQLVNAGLRQVVDRFCGNSSIPRESSRANLPRVLSVVRRPR